LFEQVNIESEKQKRLDIIYNSLIDVQRCNEDNQNLVEYVQKEIREIKKTKEKKNLIAQIGDVVGSAGANNTRSVGIKKNAE
jgi:translation initiation factor 2 beta subunit (eIF-2beta)/eIF-5